MKATVIILISLLFFIVCENNKNEEIKLLSFKQRLSMLSDSVQVEGITIKNLFKSQILAHQEDGTFDEKMIIEKVYRPHKALWTECYAMIFGEENAHNFNTEKGMVNWNKELYLENKDFFEERAEILLNINLDSLFENDLKCFNKLLPYKVKSTISIAFSPILGIHFGGCSDDQFVFELNSDQDFEYLIKQGIPHELNHLAYEPLRENDPQGDTALRQTIDEGLACYFTWVFFDDKITKHEAVENMTKEEWNWYIKNEKQLFEQTKKYFNDESGDNPLLRNNKFKLFEQAPKSLNYWLGFRIVEMYVEKHGKDSWKDIYELDVQDVLKRSNYENYIQKLK